MLMVWRKGIEARAHLEPWIRLKGEEIERDLASLEAIQRGDLGGKGDFEGAICLESGEEDSSVRWDDEQ